MDTVLYTGRSKRLSELREPGSIVINKLQWAVWVWTVLKALLRFKPALRVKWLDNGEIGCICDMAQELRVLSTLVLACWGVQGAAHSRCDWFEVCSDSTC
jgi:hypothetical protein